MTKSKLAALASALLLAACSPMSPPTPQAPQELRGLWVDAFGAGLKNRVQVRQVVEDAARMGVNRRTGRKQDSDKHGTQRKHEQPPI